MRKVRNATMEHCEATRILKCTDLLLAKLNDTTLNHFPVQIITLSSTLSNASEHRETT